MTIIQQSAGGWEHRFTHLFARISEEDDCYVVQVRLRNEATPALEDSAWGEEIAESIESAAEMIATLAEWFFIPRDRITLEIRMDNLAGSTRHWKRLAREMMWRNDG
jgi:hypothetical protein